jgi:hypothetical protein
MYNRSQKAAKRFVGYIERYIVTVIIYNSDSDNRSRCARFCCINAYIDRYIVRDLH